MIFQTHAFRQTNVPACVLAGALMFAAIPGAVAQQDGDLTIRGENVLLLEDPAADAPQVALLQRGDVVTVTGDAETADGQTRPFAASDATPDLTTYVPVEVIASGDTGWVREIFIDPRSTASLAVGDAASADESAASQPETGGNANKNRNKSKNRQNQQNDTAGTTNGNNNDSANNQAASNDTTGDNPSGAANDPATNDTAASDAASTDKQAEREARQAARQSQNQGQGQGQNGNQEQNASGDGNAASE